MQSGKCGIKNNTFLNILCLKNIKPNLDSFLLQKMFKI